MNMAEKNLKEGLAAHTDASDDTVYMREAIREAELAAAEGEVPVGAVIVRDGRIIGRGRNARESDKNALAHAELIAINEACRKLGGWRLTGCKLYVTMEPCPMCAGAIINARVPEVVCAVKDAKAGAFGSVIDLNSYPLNHKTAVRYGACEGESLRLVTDFFADLRKKLRSKC